MKHLSEIDKHFAGYYFLFTLNDYEAERLEYVPPLQERIETFIELSRALGKNRVIWRFDPILRTDRTSYDDLLERAFRISRRIQPYTEKMIISFAELSYRKVRRNLAVRADLFSRDIDEYSASESERLDFCHKLKQLMPGEIQISACAQKTDLSQCGIEAAKCIDDDLMLRVCDDNDLKKFLRPEGKLFHDTEILKDPGQRKECRCVLSRDIGAYDTCPHFCLYCYADSSKEKVLTRIKNFNEEREYL